MKFICLCTFVVFCITGVVGICRADELPPEQKIMIDKILKMGGEIYVEYTNPEKIKPFQVNGMQLDRATPLKDIKVTSIYLRSTKKTDDLVKSLLIFPDLTRLDVSSPDMTDYVFVYIAKMSKLRDLRLSHLKLTMGGIERFRERYRMRLEGGYEPFFNVALGNKFLLELEPIEILPTQPPLQRIASEQFNAALIILRLENVLAINGRSDFAALMKHSFRMLMKTTPLAIPDLNSRIQFLENAIQFAKEMEVSQKQSVGIGKSVLTSVYEVQYERLTAEGLLQEAKQELAAAKK
jgi:hypothetical protein